jgi:NhaA family Na+:H+ antiporter
MGAAAAALLISNAPYSSYYEAFRQLTLSVSLGDTGLPKPLLLWINDGLMAVFFLLHRGRSGHLGIQRAAESK